VITVSKKMEELKDMLCDELYKVKKQVGTKGELSAPELDVIDKLTHSIKSIATIIAMEDYEDDEDDGYSERGNSYARGRRYARRDSMGRYSKDGGYYNNYGYSRNDSKNQMLNHIESMMNEAQNDPAMRRMIMDWKQQIENM